MSIIDTVNQLILRRLQGPRAYPAVVGDDVQVQVGDRCYGLPELASAIAYEADVHAGFVIALALEFSNGRTLTVTQVDPCWNDLLAALDRLKLTILPSRDWLTAMIAETARGHTIVLRGGSTLEGEAGP